MKSYFLGILTICSALYLTGCKDDDDTYKPVDPDPNDSIPITPGGGSVTLNLTHYVDNELLNYNTQTYISPGNQEYIVSDFKYYVSNINLHGGQNVHFAEQESYHLVQHHDLASMNIELSNLAPGTYNSITFSIGVDSVRNHTGAQTGALDPVHGMLWDWNTGYKFLQLEGSSPSSPQPTSSILYHVGHDHNYRTITIPLSPAIQVSNSSNHHVLVKANINRMFGTAASPVLFSDVHTVMGLSNSTLLADNYAQMFSLDAVLTIME